ncbi:MAG: GIY-YIG nuclease family protein [Patescibacteria group bacterium]
MVRAPRSTAGRSQVQNVLFLYFTISKNNSYYYGSTNNLQKRLKEHNNGETKATRYKRPWKLVYFEEYKTLSEARKREYQVKTKKRKSYVKWLIDNKK